MQKNNKFYIKRKKENPKKKKKHISKTEIVFNFLTNNLATKYKKN